MTRDPICPATHQGVRCQRWNLPAAHWDDIHQAGSVTWPYERQLTLDLDVELPALPALTAAGTAFAVTTAVPGLVIVATGAGLAFGAVLERAGLL